MKVFCHLFLGSTRPEKKRAQNGGKKRGRWVKRKGRGKRGLKERKMERRGKIGLKKGKDGEKRKGEGKEERKKV
jgi:hypothetical protein